MVALEDIVETHGALALALGVHRNTVVEWSRKPDFPRNADGTYSIEAVKEWREAWQQKTPDDLRERRLLAECIKLELANEETRGELVRRKDVKAEYTEMLSEFKSILDGLPDDIAKDLPDEHRITGHANARHRVHLALKKMMAWNKKLDDLGGMPDSSR